MWLAFEIRSTEATPRWDRNAWVELPQPTGFTKFFWANIAQGRCRSLATEKGLEDGVGGGGRERRRIFAMG